MTRHLRLLDSGCKLAVVNHAASGIAQEAPQTDDRFVPRLSSSQPSNHTLAANANEDGKRAGANRLPGQRRSAGIDQNTRFHPAFRRQRS